ncbi:cobalamin-binding protein [Polynucleobacter sp.]|uniref:cobalamin-binding protein n=1 Tax=Polynucleobacter sp. TaxID=2029855 RepID=UPI00333E8F87
MINLQLPSRIICLTEETTEWLYMLGQQDRIVGISGYTVRPPEARKDKPKISAFLTAKIDQILALKPDCVFGFSDLQADIASALIRQGIQVTIFNQRSIEEIFSMLYQVGAIVGQADEAVRQIELIKVHLKTIQLSAQTFNHRPKVYFEEWDSPYISGIQWVSELVELAGGKDCFPELAKQSLAKNRMIHQEKFIIERNPDIIIGSWCGKKFRPNQVMQRAGWENISAVKNHQIFEIKSPFILQPGPAALTEGVEQIHQIILNWQNNQLMQ